MISLSYNFSTCFPQFRDKLLHTKNTGKLIVSKSCAEIVQKYRALKKTFNKQTMWKNNLTRLILHAHASNTFCIQLHDRVKCARVCVGANIMQFVSLRCVWGRHFEGREEERGRDPLRVFNDRGGRSETFALRVSRRPVDSRLENDV